MSKSTLRRFMWPVLSALVAALVVIGIVVVTGGGGTEEASAQTVRFEKPTETGANPFTNPADVRGKTKIKPAQPEKVGQGPFGGTGSDRVCDRELLIKSLKARPDRLREWARVAGVRPTYRAVARYIRKLKPVTLTRDTRVTNHSFVNGRAVPFQSILQAGTAVLVDKSGRPVARCRCGNPLLEPVYYPSARCLNCPAGYQPPPPCEPYGECWKRYPNPPPIHITVVQRTTPPPAPAPTPTTTTTTPTQTTPPPSSGLQCDPPRSQLESEQCAARNAPPQQTQTQTQPPPTQTQTTPPSSGVPECSDGIDNDNGGQIDLADPQCTGPSDTSESY
jgi:hypothetical protein